MTTRNILDCDQPNYSSRIIFSSYFLLLCCIRGESVLCRYPEQNNCDAATGTTDAQNNATSSEVSRTKFTILIESA